jgi:acylphosphatase
MSGLIKHIDIHVTGRVQGVFYRASAQKEARRLGLAGWVKNEPDGSVTMEVEGDSVNLDSFVAWCRQGPKFAQVEGVKVSKGDVCNYRGFSVSYGY